MAAPKPNVAQLARIASDVKAAIALEGRIPVAVMLLFQEPAKNSQAAVRVVEYGRDERSERVIRATAEASRPAGRAVAARRPAHAAGDGEAVVARPSRSRRPAAKVS